MITIPLFAASFIMLTILFLSKHREVKTGDKTFIGKFLSRFDAGSMKILNTIHYRFYQLIQTVRFIFLVHLPEKSRVKISKTKDTVLHSYNKQKDVIMGKKELQQNGSSSFFLRKVTDHKKGNGGENGERGKIEDESMGEVTPKKEVYSEINDSE
jgi:hypothetical protein